MTITVGVPLGGEELAGLRASAESASKSVVDVPEQGTGAFSYVDDSLILYWNDGNPSGRLYTLHVRWDVSFQRSRNAS